MKKLRLSRETVRLLSTGDLREARAQAGISQVDGCTPTSESCPQDTYLHCPMATLWGLCTVIGCVPLG